MSSLTAYLSSHKENVTVVCNELTARTANGSKVKIPYGIRVVRIPVQGSIPNIVNTYIKTINDLIKKNKYDVVLASVGPYFPLRFCYKIFPRAGLKYCIDFRDIGAFEKIEAKNITQLMRILVVRSIQAFYEFCSIARAEYVVSVTDGWCDKKKRNYPLFAKKMRVIENGYDDERLKELGSDNPPREAHTIAIIGKLAYYAPEYAKMLFEAIKRLTTKYPDIKLLHINDKEEEIDDICRTLHFPTSAYEVTGFIDYLESIRQLHRASILLVVDKRKDAMGTKVYDYLYMNRPIIYAGPRKTKISEFVENFSEGYSCQSIEQVVQVIEDLFIKRVCFLDSATKSEQYARSIQNAKFFALLENTTKGKSR